MAAALDESLDFEIIRHNKARRYVIRVRDDGSVRVTIPRWGSRREARAFAEEQRAWIERQRRRAAERRRRLVPEPYADGQVAALRARARLELPAELARLAAAHGLSVSRVSIRNQRWRWGSCSPAGHICLNWRLITMPPFVREYVLIHELMHLKRLDHSRAFWRLVAGACPDYGAARRWLRENGATTQLIGAIS